ncbi:MAG: phage tail protein [Saprospiraceae bacterium]|nr:phage tail protein [Saprospiraceae bacterium]
MAEPFLGEIKIVGFNFAPKGWASCDGQLLPINQNQSLYSLLGTMYGGNGTTSFGLPDLRGRTPLHFNDPFPQGQKGGEENHTLSIGEIPQHQHALNATAEDANTGSAESAFPAKSPTNLGAVYSSASSALNAQFNGVAVSMTGSGVGHNNMQPFIALNFCIALQGLFPSPN